MIDPSYLCRALGAIFLLHLVVSLFVIAPPYAHSQVSSSNINNPSASTTLPGGPSVNQLPQGQAGVISIETSVSCTGLSQGLDCGGPEGTATVLQLQVPLGGSTPFSYDFQGSIPNASYQPGVGNDGSQSAEQCAFTSAATSDAPLGRCMVTRKMRLTVEVSEPVLCYPLSLRGDLQIPHTYYSLYSMAFGTMQGVPAKTPEAWQGQATKIGAGNTLFAPYIRTDVIRSSNAASNDWIRDYASAPWVGSVHVEEDGKFGTYSDCANTPFDDTSVFSTQYANGACKYREGPCAMCSLFTRQYINDQILDPSTFDEPLYSGCEFDNGYTTQCGKTFFGTTKCSCGGDYVDTRYCGNACDQKYAQVIKPNYGGRIWAGSLGTFANSYKCFNPGNIYGWTNTGVNHTCISECLAGRPLGCQEYDCIDKSGRWPLMDDCVGPTSPDTRKLIRDIPGPEVVAYQQPVCIGCSSSQGITPQIPNQAPHDPTQGACNADESNPNCVPCLGFDGSIHVAVCPPAVCLTGSRHDDWSDYSTFRLTMDNNAICSDDQKPINQQDCQTPWPLWSDDDSGYGHNEDDVHPDDSRDYFSRPLAACALTNRDRTGAISTVQSTADPYNNNVQFHSTAEAVGLSPPWCSGLNVGSQPIPFYTVTLTLYDITDTVVNPPVISTVVLSDFDQQFNGAKLQGLSSDGSMFVKDIGLQQVSGRIGPDLGPSMIVMCNASDPQLGQSMVYGPPISINMGGNATSTAADPNGASRNYINPWLEIAKNCTHIKNVDESTAACKLNNGRVVMLPLPEVVNGMWSFPHGAWWYWVAPEFMHTYGTGCGQIGLDLEFFGNEGNAAQACSKERHACIPGWIPGKDWLLNQRWFDSDMGFTPTNSGNGGLFERWLRDEVLEARPPCPVSAQMQDAMHDVTTCAQARQRINGLYRNLPSPWVPAQDAADGKCFPPNWFTQDQCLVYSDSSGASNIQGQYMVLLSVALADITAFSVSAEVSPGVFLPDEDLTKECNVGQDSDNGRILVYVQNIGNVTGNYEVTGSCDQGVTLVQDGDISGLAPNGIATTQVRLQHSGGIPSLTDSSTSCKLLLEPGDDVLPGTVFSTMTLKCGIAPNIVNAASGIRNPYDQCKEDQVNCDIPPLPQPSDLMTYAMIFELIIIWMAAIFLVIAACMCWNNHTADVVSYKKLKREVQTGGN